MYSNFTAQQETIAIVKVFESFTVYFFPTTRNSKILEEKSKRFLKVFGLPIAQP
jgi:hypothetical protein